MISNLEECISGPHIFKLIPPVDGVDIKLSQVKYTVKNPDHLEITAAASPNGTWSKWVGKTKSLKIKVLYVKSVDDSQLLHILLEYVGTATETGITIVYDGWYATIPPQDLTKLHKSLHIVSIDELVQPSKPLDVAAIV